jgi:hypothetical protein
MPEMVKTATTEGMLTTVGTVVNISDAKNTLNSSDVDRTKNFPGENKHNL